MKYNILHLIDTVDQVNFGIWNAALINSSDLKSKGVISYAAYPENDDFSYPDVKLIPLNNQKDLFGLMEEQNLSKKDTIVVSHGCWRWATKFGSSLKDKGYHWVAVPQGMLEPWSRSQKALKKKIYWNLIEKRLLKKADAVRAVSRPEMKNLHQYFGSQLKLIPNGIEVSNFIPEKKSGKVRFLFMARLHHKKGITPLVKGWLSSSLVNSDQHELIIAGPDDGELQEILPLIQKSKNIIYSGAVYGETKTKLLENSHVYVLPSFSEGFPSSVLEGMDKALMPLISEGCNFPEAFENNIAILVEPDQNNITKALMKVGHFTLKEIIAKGNAAREFVVANYTNKKISEELYDLYFSILSEKDQN